MDETRLAPTVGIAACLAVLGVLAVPYLVVDSGAAVGTYYGTGSVNPLVAGLFALVAVIVFAAGRERRSDPSLAAGATLALGLFGVGVSLLWALTVPESVVVGMSTATVVEYHRWVLVVVSLGVPAGGAWFARSLGVL
jgi:hypothetical protein